MLARRLASPLLSASRAPLLVSRSVPLRQITAVAAIQSNWAKQFRKGDAVRGFASSSIAMKDPLAPLFPDYDDDPTSLAHVKDTDPPEIIAVYDNKRILTQALDEAHGTVNTRDSQGNLVSHDHRNMSLSELMEHVDHTRDPSSVTNALRNLMRSIGAASDARDRAQAQGKPWGRKEKRRARKSEEQQTQMNDEGERVRVHRVENLDVGDPPEVIGVREAISGTPDGRFPNSYPERSFTTGRPQSKIPIAQMAREEETSRRGERPPPRSWPFPHLKGKEMPQPEKPLEPPGEPRRVVVKSEMLKVMPEKDWTPSPDVLEPLEASVWPAEVKKLTVLEADAKVLDKLFDREGGYSGVVIVDGQPEGGVGRQDKAGSWKYMT